MPGQATSYKIGAIEIERLRKKSRKALGRKFSLAEFHQVILGKGALPLDILEQQVDVWLEQKQRPLLLATRVTDTKKDPIGSFFVVILLYQRNLSLLTKIKLNIS